MTNEERKIKIKEIMMGEPVQTGTRLKYKGEIKEFPVYQIPLEFLAYNKDNGRISSLVKSYAREHGPLNANNSTDSVRIEKFLYESNKERNSKTLKDLAENGQMEPGIITIDGIIVDGNRRASLLKRISESSEYNQTVKDRCSYFLARILPEDADEKEILRLETSYQMGADSKVDYNPIEKYLHTRDMHDKGFSSDQIAEYMGLESSKDVRLHLEIINLIDQYLETYGYAGIYTRLPRGCEDDFIKLNTAIKKIHKGGVAWIPTDELDEVESDLKNISFDYIRLEEKGDFDFRAIAVTSKNNFLNDENNWKQFVNQYYSHFESVPEEENTEEILAKAKTDEEAFRLLNQRDNTWKQKCREKLMDVFTESKTVLENNKVKDKPETLIRKAISTLNAVDVDLFIEDSTKKNVSLQLDELEVIIKKIKLSL